MAADIEIGTRSIVVVSLRLSQRRGVWCVGTDVWSKAVPGLTGPLVRYQGEYPNSRANALSSYLFSHLNSVAQMADAAYQDHLRQALAREK